MIPQQQIIGAVDHSIDVCKGTAEQLLRNSNDTSKPLNLRKHIVHSGNCVGITAHCGSQGVFDVSSDLLSRTPELRVGHGTFYWMAEQFEPKIDNHVVFLGFVDGKYQLLFVPVREVEIALGDTQLRDLGDWCRDFGIYNIYDYT